MRDPEGEPGRFGTLAPDDIAVLEFTGEPGPRYVTLLLVRADSAIDGPLHAGLDPLVPGGRRTMTATTRAQIADAAAMIAPTHPIWTVAADPIIEAALEDAAQGGAKGTETISRRGGRAVSAAALAAAKEAAERNGREGEALAWVHLQRMRDAGSWSEVEWASKNNAVAPFDFRAHDARKAATLIDAKSTGGEFGRVLHMSIAELLTAAVADRYDLWRIFAIDGYGAHLKIAENIGLVAKSILAGLSLPAGVTVDSVSIDPAMLQWGPEIVIERPDDPSADE